MNRHFDIREKLNNEDEFFASDWPNTLSMNGAAAAVLFPTSSLVITTEGEILIYTRRPYKADADRVVVTVEWAMTRKLPLALKLGYKPDDKARTPLRLLLLAPTEFLLRQYLIIGGFIQPDKLL